MIFPTQSIDSDRSVGSTESLDLGSIPADGAMDALVQRVATTFDVPVVTLTFADGGRQWVQSEQGVDGERLAEQTPFAGYTLQESGPFVVTDATRDERFASNPMVTGESHVRFYAGQPIRTPDGVNVGALSMMDFKPRLFSFGQRLELAGIVAGIEQSIAGRSQSPREKSVPTRPSFKTVAAKSSPEQSAPSDLSESLLEQLKAGNERDQTFVGLLVERFAETAPKLCAGLSQSAEEDSHQRTFQLANTLKCLAGQVDGGEIRAVCIRIEDRALTKKPIDQTLIAELQRTVSEFGR